MTELSISAITDAIRNDFDSLSEIQPQDMIAALEYYDDTYHNGDDSPLTDSQYDTFLKYVKSSFSDHMYFAGVGSPTPNKVKLPHKMGSLDQVEIGDIQNWISKWNVASQDIIITDKMDGISCLLIYDNYTLKGAYSRGDGIMGQNILKHVIKMNVPKTISIKKMAVRGEIEISETNFMTLKELIKSKSGREYRNARNAIAGLMNRKDPVADSVYDLIDLIVYEILEEDEHPTGPESSQKGNQENEVC